MQINLKNVVERVNLGYGEMLIHRFEDANLERINGYSSYFYMEFINEFVVKLYFEIIEGRYHVDVVYDFNNDMFSCCLVDSIGKVYVNIMHVDMIDNVVNYIEDIYVQVYHMELGSDRTIEPS